MISQAKDFIVYNFSEKIYRFLSSTPVFIKKPFILLITVGFRANLKYRRMPSSLTIFVTERCNLKCKHCFICNSPETGDKKEMLLADYRKLFQSFNGKISSIKITGGEPTLRVDLAQLIISASKIGHVKYVTIFTNGAFPDRLAATLEEVIKTCTIMISVQVSLDGTEYQHDRIRGEKGAYRKTIASMQALSTIKIKYPRRIVRLSVATGILRENEAELQDIANTVKSYQFEHVISFPRSSQRHVFNISDEWKSNYYPMGYPVWELSEMAVRLEMMKKIFWREKMPSLFKKMNRITLDVMMETANQKVSFDTCYAGISDLIIYPNGDVSRCEMLKSSENLTNFNYDLRRLIHSQRYRNYLNVTNRCRCLNDCAIVSSVLYDSRLLMRLFL